MTNSNAAKPAPENTQSQPNPRQQAAPSSPETVLVVNKDPVPVVVSNPSEFFAELTTHLLLAQCKRDLHMAEFAGNHPVAKILRPAVQLVERRLAEGK